VASTVKALMINSDRDGEEYCRRWFGGDWRSVRRKQVPEQELKTCGRYDEVRR